MDGKRDGGRRRRTADLGEDKELWMLCRGLATTDSLVPRITTRLGLIDHA